MTWVGLYFSKSLRVASISLRGTHQYECPRRPDEGREGEKLDFRFPSLELTKIQASPGLLPNREPSGSVLIMCSMAFPTRPEPPVTRITSPLVMIIKGSKKVVVCVGRRFTVIENGLSDQPSMDSYSQGVRLTTV